jgi:hypothetical protein
MSPQKMPCGRATSAHPLYQKATNCHRRSNHHVSSISSYHLCPRSPATTSISSRLDLQPPPRSPAPPQNCHPERSRRICGCLCRCSCRRLFSFTQIKKTVISTEAAHSLIVSSVVEKSASPPQLFSGHPRICICGCLFSSTGHHRPGAPSIATGGM